MDCPFDLQMRCPAWALVNVEVPVQLELKNVSDRELVDISVTIEESGGENRLSIRVPSLRPGASGKKSFSYFPSKESGCGPMITIRGTQHPQLTFSTTVRFGSPVVEYSTNMSFQVNAPDQNEGVIAPLTLEGDIHIGDRYDFHFDSREKAIMEMNGSIRPGRAKFDSVDWKPTTFDLPVDSWRRIRMCAVQHSFEKFSYGPKSAPQAAEFSSGGYWLSSHPITREEFRSVMGNSADQILDRVPGGPEYSEHRQDRVPITYLKWSEAREFCNRLTRYAYEKDLLPPELVFRLPTEAEWEYACTKGTGRPFYHDDPLKIAWTLETSDRKITNVSVLQEGEAGYRIPNEFGLYDLHGLVYEWCLDEYQPIPNVPGRIDPWVRWLREDAGYRVCRGGAYFCGLDKATSRSRAPMKIDGRREYRGFIGFRVALGLPVEE